MFKKVCADLNHQRIISYSNVESMRDKHPEREEVTDIIGKVDDGENHGHGKQVPGNG
jgi:hypothetical protein